MFIRKTGHKNWCVCFGLLRKETQENACKIFPLSFTISRSTTITYGLWCVCIVLYFPHVVWLLRKGGEHGEKKMKMWDLVYPIQPKSMKGSCSSIFPQLFIRICIDCSIIVFSYCFVIFCVSFYFIVSSFICFFF